jgi:hypothetical protein
MADLYIKNKDWVHLRKMIFREFLRLVLLNWYLLH